MGLGVFWSYFFYSYAMTVFVTLNHFQFIYSKKCSNHVQLLSEKKKKILENGRKETPVQIAKHKSHQLHHPVTVLQKDCKKEKVSALEMENSSIALQYLFKPPRIYQPFKDKG